MDYMGTMERINKTRMEGLVALEEILEDFDPDFELPNDDVIVEIRDRNMIFKGWAIADSPENIVAWNSYGFIEITELDKKVAWEEIEYYRKIKNGNYNGKIW